MRGVDVNGRSKPTSHLGVMLAAIVVVAACTGGAHPSPANPGAPTAPRTPALAATPSPTASPAASGATVTSAPSASAPITAAPSLAVVATPGPVPVRPPVATLRGLPGNVVPRGQLGSYTWGSAGSDAPWIVGRVLAAATAGSSLDVSLDGGVPAGWTAAWAAVSGGMAGSPSGGVSGAGDVAVTAPGVGDWSLRVTATFGPGHNATYFWHLTVTE